MGSQIKYSLQQSAPNYHRNCLSFTPFRMWRKRKLQSIADFYHYKVINLLHDFFVRNFHFLLHFDIHSDSKVTILLAF